MWLQNFSSSHVIEKYIVHNSRSPLLSFSLSVSLLLGFWLIKPEANNPGKFIWNVLSIRVIKHKLPWSLFPMKGWFPGINSILSKYLITEAAFPSTNRTPHVALILLAMHLRGCFVSVQWTSIAWKIRVTGDQTDSKQHSAACYRTMWVDDRWCCEIFTSE